MADIYTNVYVCVHVCVCVYMHAYSLNREMRSKSGALNPRTGPYKKRKCHVKTGTHTVIL